MQLGMIGAGRMGGNMAIRLMKAGHECVVYARHEQSIKEAVDQGAKGTTDLKEFVRMLAKPRRRVADGAGRIGGQGAG